MFRDLAPSHLLFMTDAIVNLHANAHGEVIAFSMYQRSPSKGMIVIPFKSIKLIPITTLIRD